MRAILTVTVTDESGDPTRSATCVWTLPAVDAPSTIAGLCDGFGDPLGAFLPQMVDVEMLTNIVREWVQP